MQKLANAQYPKAQSKLGWMYREGIGVERDSKEAIKWFRLAAEQGYAEAQNYLACMTSDATEAFKWQQLAAHQGFATGQMNLGWRYEIGRGVAQSDAEPAKWYRIAAENNKTEAAYYLSGLERFGRIDQTSPEGAFQYLLDAEAGSWIARQRFEKLPQSLRDAATAWLSGNLPNPTSRAPFIDIFNRIPLSIEVQDRLFQDGLSLEVVNSITADDLKEAGVPQLKIRPLLAELQAMSPSCSSSSSPKPPKSFPDSYLITLSQLRRGVQISSGGYAHLYEGILNRNKKSTGVVIKEIRTEHLNNAQHRSVFEHIFVKEVAIWAKLDHPRIVMLLGFHLESLTTVMEPMKTSLHAYLTTHGSHIIPLQKLTWANQI